MKFLAVDGVKFLSGFRFSENNQDFLLNRTGIQHLVLVFGLFFNKPERSRGENVTLKL